MTISPEMRPKVYAFAAGFILLMSLWGTGFLGKGSAWSPPPRTMIQNIPTNWSLPEVYTRDGPLIQPKKR